MTDKELVAPRPLSKSDILHLRTMFELQLHITSQDEEEDASDLIDYALNMIGRGKNVGSIMEELEFMQYEVCNKTSAIKIGKCLSSFFGEISREMSGHPTNIDLSTKAASRKPSREMHQTLLSSGSISVKERSKMGIYNSKGELTKQWAGVITIEDCDFDAKRRKVLQEHALEKKKEGERTLNLNLSAKDAAMKPYVEIEALDLDTSNREIRDLIYNEEGHLVAAWNNSSDVDYEDDSSEVNLSAQASAAKHHDEVDSLLTNFRHTKKGGTIEKNKIYSQDGQLNSWNKRIIEESSPKEMDLSTTGNLKKKAQELERLRSTGSQRRGIKSQIYSEDEQLNAWNKIKSKEEVIVTPPTTEEWAPAPIIGTTKGKGSTSSIIPLGEARRKEFESVMRDRKLSREERSRRIEEIKRKYAAQLPSSSSKATSSDGFSQEEDIHNQTKGEVKLSATDAASRQRNELDFLRKSMKRGSVLTAIDQRSVMYNSRGELVGGYASNNIPREQMDHNLQMDLSTSGSIKKKDRELDMIRATGARRRNIQEKIYDSSGRLNAWNRWETAKNNVDVEVAEQSGLDMNLSAKGTEMKKVRDHIEGMYLHFLNLGESVTDRYTQGRN